LIGKFLSFEPKERIDAKDALLHPFMTADDDAMTADDV